MKGRRMVRLIRQSDGRNSASISPEVQLEKIDAHLKATGSHAVATVSEIGVPGDIERDGLNEAIEMVERGDADGVVLAVFDRLGREELGIYTALYRLEKAGGVIEFVSDPSLDPATESGRVLIAVNAAMAKAARMRITGNWKDAKSKAVMDKGIHICNVPPFGYDMGGTKKKQKPLTPNADADTVRELFKRRGEGQSSVTLARWLDEIRPQQDPWDPMKVLRILSNKVYLGIAYYGELENPHAHPPLVSRRVFEQAKKAKAEPFGRTGTPKPYSNRRLLSEVVRCAGCRHSLTPGGSHGEGTERYVCRGEHSHYTCEDKATGNIAELDEYVVSALFGVLDNRNVRALQSMTEYTKAQEELEDARADTEAFYVATMRMQRENPERWARMEAQILEREREAEAKALDLAPRPPRVGVRTSLARISRPSIWTSSGGGSALTSMRWCYAARAARLRSGPS